MDGTGGEIHEREVDVGPAIQSPFGRAASCSPEHFGAMSVARMPIRIQWLNTQRLRGAGRDAHDLVHGEHLRRAPSPGIGDDLVFRAPLREQYRLRHLREEIDDWRAPDAHGAGRESGLEQAASLAALELSDEK